MYDIRNNREKLQTINLLCKPVGKKSKSYLSQTEQRAAVRFANNFHAAELSPRISQNYEALEHGKPGKRSGTEHISVFVLDKRDEINRAVKFLGQELGGLIIDVCGYDMGLQAIEEKHDWPRRSGKVALKIALAMLARYYQTKDQMTVNKANKVKNH